MAVLVAPVLYVLSAGPAEFLNGMGAVDNGTLHVVFAALNWVYDVVPERSVDWFDSYITWWTELADRAAPVLLPDAQVPDDSEASESSA